MIRIKNDRITGARKAMFSIGKCKVKAFPVAIISRPEKFINRKLFVENKGYCKFNPMKKGHIFAIIYCDGTG